jgi:hypothetical protein
MSTHGSVSIDPNNLTFANVRDGILKYKNLRKSRLQLLCGNFLDHIEDLKLELRLEKAKALHNIELRAELKELKEAVFVSNASNVELRAELRELKEAVFVSNASNTSNWEDDVKGQHG